MPINMYQVAKLFQTVVDGDYCIGCGACASLPESPIQMVFDDYGRYRPVLEPEYSDHQDGFDVGEVCPFYPHGQDETTLGNGLYPEASWHEYVGRYMQLYAGYVITDEFRQEGSSGGMTSWILARLLDAGEIDGVIHVGSGNVRLFEYQVSLSKETVRQRAKSRYYPVEMSQVISFVRGHPGKYAFVGVPCFVKAVRLLARSDPQLKAAIKYCVAIFCGHMKTAAFAEMLAWQMGIQPQHLNAFEFRVKLEGKPAHRYGVLATGTQQGEQVSVTKPVHELYGSNWGYGLFKPQACDYCDDIAGEAADVSLGDAWLPQFQQDGRGTNVIIARHPVIARLLDEGKAQQKIELFPLEPSDIYASQAGNYRHRRDGLAYRLYLKDQRGEWRPTKRVAAGKRHLSPSRRRIYELRVAIAAKSHTAFNTAKQHGEFSVFKEALSPLIRCYEHIYNPLWKRLGKRLKKSVYHWMGR
jgi:coenzyme F420-reducing hydrogenase beta subunit